MKDIIVVTTFGGLHVFRDLASPEYYLNDKCVLEIMDAQTGEMYKCVQSGCSYISALWSDVAKLLEGGSENVQ